MRRFGAVVSVCLALLVGCSTQERIQCISSKNFKVALKSNVPSALDGYDYTICPTPDGASCDRYNEIRVLRPDQLSINITGNDLFVDQVGGSIASFKTDPSGMVDPDYRRAHHIYLSFAKAKNGKSGVSAFVDSQPVVLTGCD